MGSMETSLPSIEGVVMKAVPWQGKRDVRVQDVPYPTIQEPTDAIVRITSTNICGSDLHLYETLTAFMDAGDVMGHEPMESWRKSARRWATGRR
jgi:D-arabinose 1-dehydrogenase-like Zn-dependent alcohol dehydrogenase